MIFQQKMVKLPQYMFGTQFIIYSIKTSLKFHILDPENGSYLKITNTRLCNLETKIGLQILIKLQENWRGWG